jgi:membrane-associated phospholipid phosphatase
MKCDITTLIMKCIQYHEIYCISSYGVVLKYVLMTIICIAVFIIMGIAVSPKFGYQVPSIIAFDESISSLIYNAGSNLTDDFMILMSMYGREIVWLAVIVFMSIFAGWRGKKIAIIIVISFLIIIPLNTLFKNLFERNRPPVEGLEVHIPEKTDFAYPSGHASIVAAGASILIILFRREKELVLSIILACEAALVCISRIYVGDHYFLDVIGGALLGAGIALLSISLFRYLDPIMTGVRKYLEKEH